MESDAKRLASAEDSFRSSLEDLVTIAEKIAPHCTYTKDLVSVVKVALENDAQLGFLMSLVASQVGKR